MKIYTRNDGFEVQDASGNKPLADICLAYGGDEANWTDVTTAREQAIAAEKAAYDANKLKREAQARLDAIDKEAGCGRAVREALISLGKKGFNNKFETLEAEAAILRAQLQKEIT
jgi:hypothetical protein